LLSNSWGNLLCKLWDRCWFFLILEFFSSSLLLWLADLTIKFYFFVFCVYETITFMAFFKCRHNLWILKFSWGNHVSKFRRFIFLYPLKSAPVSLCMSKNHYWVKDHL
jgi:hypothetical protein